MASVGFWVLAAVCALGYIATPLKRGVSFVKRPTKNRRTRSTKEV